MLPILSTDCNAGMQRETRARHQVRLHWYRVMLYRRHGLQREGLLVASQDADVEAGLRRLAASEADCHAHVEPRVTAAAEGYLFQAKGPNAFLFAQLFLALESAEA